MRVRLRLAKYNLTPVASILVNGEHFRRPILVILKIPKMEMVVCDEVLSQKSYNRQNLDEKKYVVISMPH